MKVEQIYTGCLSEATYFIKSDNEAAIIDPLRETDKYLEKIKSENTTLKYIFITHFHADFVSGHVDLQKNLVLKLYLAPMPKQNLNFIQQLIMKFLILVILKSKLYILLVIH